MDADGVELDAKTEELIRSVFVYLYTILFVCGMCGNFLAFMVFSSKRFKKNSFAIYFRLLTVFDSLTLLNAFRKILLFKYYFDLKQISMLLCSSIYFISYSVPSISSWILVVISLDRMVNIIRPTDFIFRNRKNFQYLTCFLLIAFNLIIYLPILFYSKFSTSYDETTNNTSNNISSAANNLVAYNECSLDSSISVTLDWMDLLNSTCIPFCLMILFTSTTIRFLFKSRMKTKSARLNRPSVHYSLPSQQQNSSANNHSKEPTISSRDSKFAITSITLNLFFFIFNCPIVLMGLLTNYLNLDPITHYIVSTVASLIYFLNFATIFFINISVNSIFKTEFFNLFLCYKKKQQNTF